MRSSLPRGSRHLTSVLVALATLVALAGADRPTAQTRAPRSQPQRIVSLVPAVTEMLFAMGAGQQVVGVSQFDRFPQEVATRARVGALLDPDLERILGLRPDLVVTYASQEDLERQLSRAHIALFSYRHAELHDVLTTLRAVGERVGRARAAEDVAQQLEGRLNGVRARVSGAERPRVLIVFGREANSLRNVYASGGFGFLHDMLTIAGGDNVLSDVRRESVQATSELILSRRPDIIVELRPGAAAATSWQMDPAWSALSSVPAVQHRRVAVLQGDHFMIPGTRVAEAVEALAAALHTSRR